MYNITTTDFVTGCVISGMAPDDALELLYCLYFYKIPTSEYIFLQTNQLFLTWFFLILYYMRQYAESTHTREPDDALELLYCLYRKKAEKDFYT